ncbi:MAG: hypothetical protein ACNA8H_06115 [Anaerolineales bacterium]
MTLHRDIYHCPMNKTNVEGIKPNRYHGILIVTKDAPLLPDSDRLILEDVDGFRYLRNLMIETPGVMVFEMM